MSAFTTLVTTTSGYSSRGVLLQRQPMALFRTRSFSSGITNRSSITKQLNESVPVYGVLIVASIASMIGTHIAKGWYDQWAEKESALAEERRNRLIALFVEEVMLERELVTRETALAKAKTALAEERAKLKSALAEEERAKKESTCPPL